VTILDLLGLTRGPAVIIAVLIVVAAVRSPLVRRIGLRNAVRRPREAVLVMLGCVLGTALIVGSGSVSDSYTGSIRERAFERLGPIDAKVTYETEANWADANARLNASPVDGVKASAAAAVLEVPITSNTSSTPSPRARLIEVDYRRAGELTKAAGIEAGAGPTTGTAWVGQHMAERLHIKVNSVLTVHTKVPDQKFLVTKIVDSSLVTFTDGAVNAGDNLLVTPGTIKILQAQDPDVLIPTWLTLVEGTGPHTHKAQPAAGVEALRDAISAKVSPFNGTVSMVRADNLNAATQVGASAAQFLVTIGAFGIIAGLMLLVNVLLMLAEERLAELGTMRAVGMSREPLIAAFTLEGASYALVGSIIGGIAGLGLGRFMVSFASRATTATAGVSKGLNVHFFAEPKTLITGISAGFYLAALVVIGTSFRVSRLEVIRAIRGLPAPKRARRAAATPLLLSGAIVGQLVGLLGYTAKSSFPCLLGPVLGFVCLGLLVSRYKGYVLATVVSAGPVMAWCTLFLLVNRDPHAPQNAGVLAGVIQVGAGVMFLNALQAKLAGGVRRIGRGRSAISSRLGLANPLAHRVRTLLTVGPFALVVFTLVYAEGLSNLIVSEVNHLGPTIAGDYQVYASSSPARPYNFAKLTGDDVSAVAPVSRIVATFSHEQVNQRFWAVSAFDRRLLKVNPPTLLARNPAYATDKAAYSAVAANPDLIIVPTNFLYGETQSLGVTKGDPLHPPRPGDVFTMFDPASGSARDVTVAATMYSDVTGSGAFYGLAGAKDMFGSRVVENAAFIATAGDPSQFAQQLAQAGVNNGVQADVIEKAAGDFFSFVNDIVNLYRSDLGIGIVVGIAGIGVVLVRSVRDRRRQIGTLRAMGVESKQIGSSFMIEGAFVAVQGVAIGAGLGFLNVLTLTRSDIIVGVLGYEPSLPRPPIAIGVMAVLLLLASLAASYGPAKAASRIPPAVALRLVD
jgi:putative ABC transport system permease protein